MMRIPLFLLSVVFSVCIFSGCQKTRTCYHYEKPFGELKGEVKMVTDTLYVCMGNDSLFPMQVVEYQFDSLNRPTLEYMCLYSSMLNEENGEHDIMLSHTRTIKNRYDRDGRKVEVHTKMCSYQGETPDTTYTSMRLVQLNGNHEKWEMKYSENSCEDSTRYQVDKYYTKDTISILKTNLCTHEKTKQTLVFDESKRLIEKLWVDEMGNTEQIDYAYESDNQLCGTRDSVYEYDEYDNAGNWLKRFEYDDEKKMLTVLHRRIEYRR